MLGLSDQDRRTPVGKVMLEEGHRARRDGRERVVWVGRFRVS